MKKLILALLMALPCLGLAQVSTQKVNNTAVIYNSTSPVTFGANFNGLGIDYILNNQTLTGNGSIINRVLGDARYAAFANGFSISSNYVYATGTTQSFYNIIVRNNATVDGTAFLSNVTFRTQFNVSNATNFPANVVVTNGTQFISGNKTFNDLLRVSNAMVMASSGLTWAFDGTRYYMGTNDLSGIFDFEVNFLGGAASPSHVLIGGRRSGQVVLEGNNNVEITIDRNNNSGGADEFIVRKDNSTNGVVLFRVNEAGSVTVSNNLTAFGTDVRIPNQTLASSSNVLNAALGDIRYWRPMTHTFGTVTGAVNKANFDMRNPVGNSTDQIQFSAFSNMVLRSVNIFVGDLLGGQNAGVTNYSIQVFRQTSTGGGGYILTWTPSSYFKKRTTSEAASVFWKLNLTDANVNAADIQYEIRADGATNNVPIAIGGSATWFIQE